MVTLFGALAWTAAEALGLPLGRDFATGGLAADLLPCDCSNACKHGRKPAQPKPRWLRQHMLARFDGKSCAQWEMQSHNAEMRLSNCGRAQWDCRPTRSMHAAHRTRQSRTSWSRLAQRRRSPGGIPTCLAALPLAGGFLTTPLLVLALFAPPPSALSPFLFTPVLLTGLFLTGELLRR